MDEGAGVMKEVSDVLRIMLMMNGANDSNFFFLEDSLVFSCFSRSLVSLHAFPVRTAIAGPAVGGGADLVGTEGSTKGASEHR